MYYYIFDVKKFKKRKEVENIKSHLSTLGISGEYTYPSNAQSVVELIDLALSKQYTTIVAVGGDYLINEVAGGLVGKKEAMGIIPVEASSELTTLLGTDNWHAACEILRFRKISELRLGRTGSGYHFITHIGLDAKLGAEVTIELKDFMIQAKVKTLSITNFSPTTPKRKDILDITFESMSNNESVIGKISSFFGSKQVENNLAKSLFHARSMRIFTKNQVPLLLNGKVIAKTPQYIESTDEDLRLITAKKAFNFWAE